MPSTQGPLPPLVGQNAWEGDTRFTKMVGHETYSVAPRATDQMAATYGHFDNKKINMASANSMAVSAEVRASLVLDDLQVDSSAETPAQCLASCTADTTCIAYALKKGMVHHYASCLHFSWLKRPLTAPFFPCSWCHSASIRPMIATSPCLNAMVDLIPCHASASQALYALCAPDRRGHRYAGRHGLRHELGDLREDHQREKAVVDAR